jgi:hypothetical protein
MFPQRHQHIRPSPISMSLSSPQSPHWDQTTAAQPSLYDDNAMPQKKFPREGSTGDVGSGLEVLYCQSNPTADAEYGPPFLELESDYVCYDQMKNEPSGGRHAGPRETHGS